MKRRSVLVGSGLTLIAPLLPATRRTVANLRPTPRLPNAFAGGGKQEWRVRNSRLPHGHTVHLSRSGELQSTDSCSHFSTTAATSRLFFSSINM